MADGKGCVCHAYCEYECACGADWTPQEVYDLRAEVERLRDAMQDIGLAITAYDAASGRARHDYDMVCAGGLLYDAVQEIHDAWRRGLDTQPLPAPPVEEE